MNARRPSITGFTLIEAVLALGISSILFVGVSTVLSASLGYARDVSGVIRFQQEQARVYLALRNAVGEMERVLYSGTDKVILRNRSGGNLLPFTIIEKTADGRLTINDFTLDPGAPTTPTKARSNKTVGSYTLQAATNQVMMGSGTAPCTSTLRVNCILFGYKSGSLAFGETGNAPFVSAPYLGDIRIVDADYIAVLSPYEKREYRIRVTAGQVPTVTATATTGEFPSYYVGSTATTPALGAATSMAGTVPATKPFQFSSFLHTANVTAAALASPVQLDEIKVTLSDASNTTRTTTIALPFMVRR